MNQNNDEVLEKEPQEVKDEVYECPSCGANLTFEPEEGLLACHYCGYKMELEGEKSNEELDFLSAKIGDETWEGEVKILHCENCGANNVVEANAISQNCPFCNSSLITNTDQLPGRRPNRVIPFKVSEDNSLLIYRNWLKRKFFAPSKIKKNIPSPVVKGVYLPAWTFDTVSFSQYKGRLGKYYTTTVGTGKNRHTVTRVRYFRISGVKQVFHDDILVTSGKKVDQTQMNKIAPFATNQSFVYDPRYLSGFTAEHYEVKLDEGWEHAKDIAKKEIEKIILEGYNYDVVSYLNVHSSYSNIKYKYVLLPIWICSYQYNNKQYQFFVNGETGKLNGRAPVSPIKVMVTIFIILVVIAVVVILFAVYGNSNGNISDNFPFDAWFLQ